MSKIIAFPTLQSIKVDAPRVDDQNGAWPEAVPIRANGAKGDAAGVEPNLVPTGGRAQEGKGRGGQPLCDQVSVCCLPLYYLVDLFIHWH